jgi:hypothetical protein
MISHISNIDAATASEATAVSEATMTAPEVNVPANFQPPSDEADTKTYFTAFLINTKNNIPHEIFNIIAEDESEVRKMMDDRFPPEDRKCPFGRRMLAGDNIIIPGQDSLQISRQKGLIEPAKLVSSIKSNRLPAR